MLMLVIGRCRSFAASIMSKFAVRKPVVVDEINLELSDEMDPSFPIELVLEAVPLSLQASARSRDAWKNDIRAEINNVLDPAGWATQSPIRVTILYFPDGPMYGDIDNIVKPILDSLMPRIYVDDNQVQRVWVEKFESDRSFQFEDPTPRLASAVETDRPVVYIRVDNEASSDK